VRQGDHARGDGRRRAAGRAAGDVLRVPRIAAGAEPKPGTPEQFGAFVQDEIVKWRDLIKTANIKLE